MKATVTNNGTAPYGIEVEGGGYRFLKPGETRTVKAANPRALEFEPTLDVEMQTDLPPPPASLASKVAKHDPPDLNDDGKPGGSPKGPMSTAAVGARRKRARRRKAAPK